MYRQSHRGRHDSICCGQWRRLLSLLSGENPKQYLKGQQSEMHMTFRGRPDFFFKYKSSLSNIPVWAGRINLCIDNGGEIQTGEH